MNRHQLAVTILRPPTMAEIYRRLGQLEQDNRRLWWWIGALLALVCFLWGLAGVQLIREQWVAPQSKIDNRNSPIENRGVAQLAARRVHSSEVAGSSPAPASSPPITQITRMGGGAGIRRLLDAIRAEESAGDDLAVGDGGRSRGPYQISEAYWRDACAQGSAAVGRPAGWDYHAEVWSAPHCQRVMLAYWRRWCPEALAAGDLEVLARVHNGGPRGANRPATIAYWHRVRQRMTAEAQRSERIRR